MTKWLISHIHPLQLTVLANLGMGLGFLVFWFIRNGWPKKNAPLSLSTSFHQSLSTTKKEASFSASEWGWLIGTGVLGGAVAPLLNTTSYQYLPASNVALITSLEGVFTVIIAWLIFKDPTSWRTLLGAVFITVGCSILMMAQVDANGWNWGGLFAMGGCFMWSLDTNIVARLGHKSQVAVMTLKSFISASVLFVVNQWFAIGLDLSPLWIIGVMLMGLIGYGIAYGLFLKALRQIGAAQAGSLIALVPFFGAFLGIWVFHELLTFAFIQALVFVALGTASILMKPRYPAVSDAYKIERLRRE